MRRAGTRTRQAAPVQVSTAAVQKQPGQRGGRRAAVDKENAVPDNEMPSQQPLPSKLDDEEDEFEPDGSDIRIALDDSDGESTEMDDDMQLDGPVIRQQGTGEGSGPCHLAQGAAAVPEAAELAGLSPLLPPAAPGPSRASPATPADLVSLRALSVRSAEAGAMQLRPSLQVVADTLGQVLTNSVELGHSNSVLLIGPRGVGKTLALERALSAAVQRYNTDPANPSLGVVRLSGLVHTDDRAAFKDIARQLCHTFRFPFNRGSSMQSNIEFLGAIFSELKETSKHLVFVMDEFDQLARAGKQTLLYTLLDTMRHRQAPVVVVGLTCRLDATELLEKRVQSRFSHRKLQVPWSATSQETGERPQDLLRSLLQLPPEWPGGAQLHNQALESALTDQQVVQVLQGMAFRGVSPRELSHLALAAMSATPGGGTTGVLQARHLMEAAKAQRGMWDSQASVVAGLSICQLFLLVAALRRTRNGDPITTFESVWEEYSKLRAMGTGVGRVDDITRPAALRAFEQLLALSLLMPCTGGRASTRAAGLLQYQPVAMLVAEDEVEAGLRGHPNAPDVLRSWLASEAVNITTEMD